MAKTFEETFDECLTVLKREFIIHGHDGPTFTDSELQAVRILVRGGVMARDFSYAIKMNGQDIFNDSWNLVLQDALLRRADINSEIAEAQS